MKPWCLVALVTLAACGGAAAPSAPLDTQIVVAMGQRTTVAEAGLSVTFASVMGDSRCPIDAICIQGGDAVVALDVDGLGRRASVELHTGDTRRTTQHEGVTITLVDLHPYPFGARPQIPPAEYRATLRLTR